MRPLHVSTTVTATFSFCAFRNLPLIALQIFKKKTIKEDILDINSLCLAVMFHSHLFALEKYWLLQSWCFQISVATEILRVSQPLRILFCFFDWGKREHRFKLNIFLFCFFVFGKSLHLWDASWGGLGPFSSAKTASNFCHHPSSYACGSCFRAVEADFKSCSFSNEMRRRLEAEWLEI